MRFFRKISVILGFGKDEEQQHEAVADASIASGSSPVGAEFPAPTHHLPRKGFSVPVQVPVERAPLPPLLVPCPEGDGGLQNPKQVQVAQHPPLPPPNEQGNRSPRRHNHRKKPEKEEEDTVVFGKDPGANGLQKYETPTRPPESGLAPSIRRKLPPEPTTRQRFALEATEPNSTSQKTSESCHHPNLHKSLYLPLLSHAPPRVLPHDRRPNSSKLPTGTTGNTRSCFRAAATFIHSNPQLCLNT